MLKDVIYSKRLLIRDIKENDFSFVNNMYKDLNFYFYAVGSSTNLSKKYYNYFTNKDDKYTFFCIANLLENNNLVGCVECNIYCGKMKILWITSIMIDKEFCRKGYGTELVLKLIDYFKLEHKIDYVCASVAGKNKIGKMFWSNLDFKIINTISRYDTQQLMFGDILIYCKVAK